MEAKFKIHDKVIMSGVFTGLGDMEAYIVELYYDDIREGFFYVTKISDGSWFKIAEKFLKAV